MHGIRIRAHPARIALSTIALCLAGGGARAQSQLTPFSNWMTYVGQQPGFTVTQGDAVPFTSSTGCVPYIDVLGSCFGNNPTTPYVIMQVPLGKATLPNWAINPAFEGPPPSGTSLDNFYQLSMNEALVTVITLPPVGAYWSFQTYLIERDWIYYNNGEPTTGCPSTFTDASGIQHVTTPAYDSTDPNNCGYDVFGMFNNTINNADVFNQFGQGFSDANLSNPVAISVITTPNQALYNTLQQDFSAPQGQSPFGSATQIFPEVMPTSGPAALNVGLPQTSDLFGSIIRYSLPETAAGRNWLQYPGSYINVYRVYSSATPTSFPTPTQITQSYNTDECDLGSNGCSVTRYQSDLAELSNILLTYLNSLGADTYTTASAGNHSTNGVGCIAQGTFCQGSTNDNDSYRSYALGLLPTGSYAIMVGVLHSTSAGDTTAPPGPVNNSVYTAVSWADGTKDMVGISENQGVGDAAQSNVSATGFASPQALTGSAGALLTKLGLYGNASAQLKADLPDLYAAVLSRSVSSCGIALCNPSYFFVHIISGSPTTEGGIPTTDDVSVTERAYLLPGTPNPLLPPAALLGADAPYLLGPTIICDESINHCK